MCGIVGFTKIIDLEMLRKMNETLIHRGPDDSGEFIDKENRVCLAMRRLSIIDLEGGHQPMSNEDQTIWVVCNGEIFNFQALRKELKDCGHQFKSHHSDTEVLIHLYEEKGIDMLSRLNGMFAFVIYDKKKGVLFGARDRMGIKPLYYVNKGSFFSFASEPKSLLSLPIISKDLDFQSLYDYMSLQCIPAPRTIFRDINKIPAAHYFTFDLTSQDFKTDKYWDLPESKNGNLSLFDLIDSIRHQAKQSVLDWSISDVSFACSLSGGIDSSSIVGLLCSSGLTNPKTFSLGFGHKKERMFDERELAKKTAQKWGTQHYETILEPDDLLNDLDKMIWHLDEPYAGGLPSWYVFKAMKGKVKVALTGTGGDELFGNYGKWRAYENIFHRLRQIAKLSILDSAPLSTLSMLRRFPKGYLYHRYFTESMKKRFLFNGEILGKVEPTEKYLQKIWQDLKGRSPRDVVPYIDFKIQLPEEFLHMTDKFSMAHSIEARTPFLDHRLVELVMRIPAQMRTSFKSLKYLFIKSMKDVLIKEVINAPKKGFVLPIDRWLKNVLREKVEHYLGESYLKKQGLFNKNLYQFVVRPYFRGKRYLDDFVWTAFMFQLWHKNI